MKKSSIFTIVMILQLLVLTADAESYKFAIICDTRSNFNKSGTNGVNVAAVKAICRDLKNKGAEFVLAPGDLISGNIKYYQPSPPASTAQLETFLKAAKSQGVGLPGSKAKILLYPVRGNHEDYHQLMTKEQVMQAWTESIGKFMPSNGPVGQKGFTYWFKWKGDLFIGIDEFIHTSFFETKGIRLNQTWLDGVLSQQDGHVFVFGHTPAFSAHHQDCLGENPSARNTFLRSIFNRSRLYFCGHDHFYARAKIPVYKEDEVAIKGYMQQIIVPSGAPFLTGSRKGNHKWDGVYKNKDVIPRTYIDNTIGYLLVTVDDSLVKIQFIGTTDSSSYTIDDKDIYHYTFKTNWEKWQFAVKDQFSVKR
jgi:calcineurin-like phosphoesterase family protein